MIPQNPASIGIEHVGVSIGSTRIYKANDARLLDNLFPHFLKRGNVHTGVRCDEGFVASVVRKAESSLDETSAKVLADFSVAFLGPAGKPAVHVATPHIRRIRDHHVVTPAQRLELGLQALQLLCRKPAKDASLRLQGTRGPLQGVVTAKTASNRAALPPIRPPSAGRGRSTTWSLRQRNGLDASGRFSHRCR